MELRLEKKWNKKELFERAKMSPSTYHGLKIDGNQLTDRTINKLAVVFGVTSEYIKGETTSKYPQRKSLNKFGDKSIVDTIINKVINNNELNLAEVFDEPVTETEVPRTYQYTITHTIGYACIKLANRVRHVPNECDVRVLEKMTD